MRTLWLALAGCILVTVLASVPVAGQTPQIIRDQLRMEIVPSATVRFVSVAGTTMGPGGARIGDIAEFTFIVRDLSTDSVTGGASPAFHNLRFRWHWVGDPAQYLSTGWATPDVSLTDSTFMRGGVSSVEQSIRIKHTPEVSSRVATIRVVANLSQAADPSHSIEESVDFTAVIYPTPGLQLNIGDATREPPHNFPPIEAVPPNTWIRIPFRVQNADLYNQTVHLKLNIAPSDEIDPSQIPVRGPFWHDFGPLEDTGFYFEVRTPKSQFYFASVSMQYTIVASNSANPNVQATTSGVVIVQGFYVSTQAMIIVPVALLLAGLLGAFIFRAQRYFNERVLGRPIPPWRIQAEAVALAELRRTSPKEYYVRRFFVMEDEYKSALLWFRSFKRRNRKAIKREAAAARLAERAKALVAPSMTRFDARAERLKRRFHLRQERQRLKLEAKMERLQDRLDRHFEDDFEKDHRKWEERVEKLTKQANRPWYRAHKKWEAQVEKTLEKWEKPFAKEKAKAEKAMEKARDSFIAEVKRKDRPAWREWKVRHEEAVKENEVLEAEGKDVLPLPLPVSQVVGKPKLSPAFEPPPRPRLPAEPKPAKVEGLPPEPVLEKPKLEASHYAKMAARLRRKTERKVRSLGRKLNRRLARNERNRYRTLARADRKRNQMLNKSKSLFEPTPLQRLLRLTPEDRERRARRNLLKALAKERMKDYAEAEKSKLELLEIELRRKEAEAAGKMIRAQAEVRLAQGAGMKAQSEPATADLETMQAKRETRLLEERDAARRRIASESVRIQRELEEQLRREAEAGPGSKSSTKP